MTAPAAPGEKLPHFVSDAPFDPYSVERMTPEQERYFLASQWKMMWWKLKRHRLAVISGAILLAMYASILVTEVLAPYNLHSRFTDFIYAPPQRVHLFHDGSFVGPFVYGFHYSLNMDNLQRIYTPRDGKTVPPGAAAAPAAEIQKLRFFCFGDRYQYFGLVPGSFHLVCPAENGTLFLMGTDRLGRDMLSRVVYGTRVSLTVGLIGVSISFLLGITIGGFAGYYGGWVDIIVQRVIEVLRSLPELPLWLALSAALPVNWSPLLVYFGITIILGLLDWTGLARAVRSKLLSLREEDFCTAAQLMGASPGRIIGRHLLPSFMSHLIASATLRIPSMILGETALSFLGLGLRPPITSWGVLLNEAQNINVVVLYPWLMLPVLPVVIMVLAFNFFGDGLRDAADPYK